jgi:3-oxoacyl-[acyl-carrier protein] reductase
VAQEVIEYGITCNAFAPNARTRASFEISAYEKAQPEGQGPWVFDNFKLPLNESPGPDDLAPFICYLATEEAAQISGSIFFVGGQAVNLYSEAEWASTITKYDGQWTVDELKMAVPRDLIGMRRSSTMQMYDIFAKKK